MINRYMIAAFVAVIMVIGSYIFNFYLDLHYALSGDTAVWGQLGDYAGGLLNPILSFLALILLIKSLNLQNTANQDLRKELKHTEKTENIRSFEALFFNMISSQKALFDSFKIVATVNEIETILHGPEAVINIEDNLENLSEKQNKQDLVVKYLELLDSNDQIFGITRSFYIVVKLIMEKLSDSQGFTAEDRKSHLLTLVNFTDFTQLRLIMICMQFLEFQSTEYLKENQEFNEVLEEISINYKLY